MSRHSQTNVMHHANPARLSLFSVVFLLLAGAQGEVVAETNPYTGWEHSGAITILTTPEGANLPATAILKGFPLLVRLHTDWFDFSQAKPKGEDIRFSTTAGAPLAYQIEHWDEAGGTACIWVRIPIIVGNSRQQMMMHWGKKTALSESRGSAVFNATNDFASVIHMNDELKDELGTVTPQNNGTVKVIGVLGEARHFAAGNGITCGDKIRGFPFSDGSFTSEAWFRSEGTNSTIVYWGRYATRFNGNTGDGNEVDIHLTSPAVLSMATDGPGGVTAATPATLGRWSHVAVTYDNGTSLIYVDGKVDGKKYEKSAMSIVKEIGMCIGGMRGENFRFAGDIDEVRISHVARSADWIRLQYENQKPLQSVVGPLAQNGTEFSVIPETIKVSEGKSANFSAKAGGAQKIYWILTCDGVTTVAAVDRFFFTLHAGRVTKDVSMTLTLKAVFANEVKTKDIPVTITEDLPEPVITLTAPKTWNGRDTIEVVPTISNLEALKAKGVGGIIYRWRVAGGAVTKEALPGKLVLKRSQYSGPITVTLYANNGGKDTVASTDIAVSEPVSDPWVQRIPNTNEKPVDNQFYARDDMDEGTLYYQGSMDEAVDLVILRLSANGILVKTEKQKPGADRKYAFTIKLKPGLIRYAVELSAKKGGEKVIVNTVKNIICGDAYIIDGQSNAEATGPNNGPDIDPPTAHNDWIRSYGNQHSGLVTGGWGNAIRTRIWGQPDYGFCQIGAWGMVLAEHLVATHHIPVCIINGSYGGTRIDQHQPNPSDRHDTSGDSPDSNSYKIYGSLLSRIEAARLTHGIRAVFWHQGENNQGSASPTGDYDWKSYQQYFMDMAANWKQDYPNLRNYYLWQIWPDACDMGGTEAGDMLLEVQRTLPLLFSHMRIMSTLGIVSGSSSSGLCHFDLEGYAQIATLMSPLVEQDLYGMNPSVEMAAPNLKRAWFTSEKHDEIVLDFAQPMNWKDGCDAWFTCNEVQAPIRAGKALDHMITLQLSAPTTATSISYLSGGNWDGRPDRLVYGTNGVAALAFSRVTIDGPGK